MVVWQIHIMGIRDVQPHYTNYINVLHNSSRLQKDDTLIDNKKIKQIKQ